MKNKAGSNGSQVPNGSPQDSRYAVLTRSNQDGRASFTGSQFGQLAAALDSVIDAGDLLSLSRTSDGGAICLYVKSGSEVFKAYAATQIELGDLLEILASSNS